MDTNTQSTSTGKKNGGRKRPPLSRAGWIGSSLLLLAVASIAGGLAAWKYSSLRAAEAASASQPEPMESVTAAVAAEREHRRTTTSIGTVLALRSITLRNELPGTVREVHLTPGQIVEAGAVLVALDVSVEEAELEAEKAQVVLAEALLGRMERLGRTNAASQIDVDRARAERDVALARIARARAIIEKKTIRAPFRARAGMADVHPGQYLDAGTLLTTLQGVDDAVHVDFTVVQQVAAGLREGDRVSILAGDAPSMEASIVAVDARVDPSTRNAVVRARIEGAAGRMPAPGASVRVRVPVGPARTAVAVPATALRRGPDGDHVFVIAPDSEGKARAGARRVVSGAMLGDEVLIEEGLSAGEQVAASGSFKLHEAVLVAVAESGGAGAGGAP